jgi:hypothetical protein
VPRRGQHRTTARTRLIAAAAALLVTGGVVVAAGSATAGTGSDSEGDSGVVSSLRDSLGMSDDEQGSDQEDQQDDGSGDDGSGDDGDADSSSSDEEDRGADEQGQDDGRGESDDQDQGGDDDAEEVEFAGRDQASPPSDDDFVDITEVDPGSGGGQGGVFSEAGSFRTDCGTNAGGNRNSDNLVLGPGKRNAAQHVHDYVGTTASFDSSDQDLRSAETSCANGDRSTYYWPVIRDLDGTGPDADEDGGGVDGNFGSIMSPKAVNLTYHGSAAGDVVKPPEGLRIPTGDAKAGTGDSGNANAQWTCTGFEDRTTTKYPLCPRGSDLVRVLDFPSCWDGENADSDDHRSHISFTEEDGSCAGDTEPIPALRMTLTYDRPDGRSFAVDSFPEQQHAPETDHASTINFMPDALLAEAVSCINEGQTC